MSTIRRFVAADDDVVLETRPHAASLASALGRACGIVCLCGAGVLGLLVLGDGPWRVASLLFAAIALAAVARAGRAVWRWDRTLLAVTRTEVMVLNQGARLKVVRLPIAEVARLSVRQTLTGRLLGYGTVELVDGRARRGLSYVPDPHDVSGIILRLREDAHDPRAAAPS